MKILSAAEVRQADAYTIENEPIASIDLMERASLAFTKIYTETAESKISYGSWYDIWRRQLISIEPHLWGSIIIYII